MPTMPTKNPPITWNQRLNAWDGDTLDAFQERLGRSHVIHAELAQLYADTMRWGKTHPFESKHLDTLMNCWTMMVLGSNIPWGEYDENSGQEFLPTMAASMAQGMLTYLDKRVHARLRDREQSAAWIAHALHAAIHLDADEAAPVLSTLAKTWHGDLRRSPAFAKALGPHALFFPWNKMQALHTKFHAYPSIQNAILQWDGICTAERLFNAGKRRAEGDPFASAQLFCNADDTPDFHAHTLSLNVAGTYLHWRWGIEPTSAFNPESYLDEDVTSTVEIAVETSQNTLGLIVEDDSRVYSKSLLQAASAWVFDFRLEGYAFLFNENEGKLMGGVPEFRKALEEHVLECSQTGQATVPLLRLLKNMDPPLPFDCSALMAATAMVHLQHFAHDEARAIIFKEDVPFLASLLRGQEMEELALSEDVNEQMLFWQLLSSPEWLDGHTITLAAQQPGVQRAILLATLVEGHGVEHWGIAADGSRQWLTALSRWYPEHAQVWEEAQRETLRSSTYRSQPMMEAVFQVQGLSVSEWSMLSQLVETPVLSLTPQSRKMMLSDVRALSIGMPILRKELAWVVETLQGARSKDATFELPVLDLGSGHGV